jgi:hypothetical protein
MNHISVDIPVPDITFIEIIVFFTCLFLAFMAFKIKEAIKGLKPPPLKHDDLLKLVKEDIDRARNQVAEDAAKQIFDSPKEAQSLAQKIAAIKGSDKFEGDPMADKGGYLAPSFDKKGPDARPAKKDYEAYIPSKDPIRIMEGKEENHFS